jgi:WD40 repeat protein
MACPEKSAASKTRVFLSYGRGDDLPFVRRLRADLVHAGFESVWFDEQSLKSRGLSFHQEIKDAIRTEVDRLVYVSGPEAARSAYVREEWQLALQFDHVIITPILRRGDYDDLPGEIRLLHCRDFSDDDDYETALRLLIEDLRQPNPTFAPLFAVPSLPDHFIGRPTVARRVRNALLVDIENPEVSTGANALIGIHGMGGIGKSVLAAALASNREVRQSYPNGVVWVPFGQNLTKDDLLRRQQDIVAHLGGDTGFTSALQGKGVLRELLQDRAVLLVLDDVWQASDVQVVDVLGPRCRILVTTRDAGILQSLECARIPVSLLSEAESLQLLADIVDVPCTELSPDARALAKECGDLPLALALSGGMAKKRGGDFASVLERLCKADLDRIGDRHSINPQHRDIWRAMQASVEMLDESQQRRFAELSVFSGPNVSEAAAATLWMHTGNLDDLATEDLLIELGERSLILLDSRSGDGGKPRRSFRLHDLLYDYAVRIAGNRKALHKSLLDAYGKTRSDGWWTVPSDGYFLDHLREHLVAAGRGSELVDLLFELPWLETKNAAGMAFDLPHDFFTAIGILPRVDDRRRILNLVSEALRRNLQFIDRHREDYPQGLFQCLWNTGWWYDHPSAADYYAPSNDKIGEPTSIFREIKERLVGHPRQNQCDGPWHSKGPKLHELLERWRRERRARAPSFSWVRDLCPPSQPLGTALLAKFEGHNGRVSAIAVSPDATRIATASKDFDTTARIWDAESGQEIGVLRGHFADVSDVAFSPDGSRIATSSHDQTATIWNARTRVKTLVLRGHRDNVTGVAFSPDGSRIVTSSADRTARTWNADSGDEINVFLHPDEVTTVAYSPDGTRIATGSMDNKAFIWDAATRRIINILVGHQGWVSGVTFSPDGSRIATSSHDDTARIWDAASGIHIRELKGHESHVTSVVFSPDGARVATGSWDNTARIWDADSGHEIRVLWGHPEWVNSVAFLPDGSRLATGSDDKTARIWDAENREPIRTVKRHQDTICGIDISPDGNCVATGSADNTACLWQVGNGRRIRTLRHQDTVWTVVFSPDSTRIATGSMDGAARLWQVSSGREIRLFEGHEDTIVGIRFSPNGARIATCSWDTTARIWDAASGQEVRVLRGHQNRVNQIVFSPDGALVATASEDKSARIWDSHSGKEIKTLRGHQDNVTGVAFSRDGKRVATFSWDMMARVWNSQTGECLDEVASSDFHRGAFESPDGTREISAAWSRFETQLVAADKQPIAWSEHELRSIVPHPKLPCWVGNYAAELFLLRLEQG